MVILVAMIPDRALRRMQEVLVECFVDGYFALNALLEATAGEAPDGDYHFYLHNPQATSVLKLGTQAAEIVPDFSVFAADVMGGNAVVIADVGAAGLAVDAAVAVTATVTGTIVEVSKLILSA